MEVWAVSAQWTSYYNLWQISDGINVSVHELMDCQWLFPHVTFVFSVLSNNNWKNIETIHSGVFFFLKKVNCISHISSVCCIRTGVVLVKVLFRTVLFLTSDQRSVSRGFICGMWADGTVLEPAASSWWKRRFKAGDNIMTTIRLNTSQRTQFLLPTHTTSVPPVLLTPQRMGLLDPKEYPSSSLSSEFYLELTDLQVYDFLV